MIVLIVLSLASIAMLGIVLAKLSTVRSQGETILANLADVQASFAKFVADIKVEVDALDAKIAAGNAVESADLDTLKAQIDAADAAVPPAA